MGQCENAKVEIENKVCVPVEVENDLEEDVHVGKKLP